MVTKVIVKDNQKAPLSYLPKLKAFANGTEYTFTDGVNIIVGENGCGKTTLLNILKSYLMVDKNECGRGQFNVNINKLYKPTEKGFCDGIDVYADYQKNTFRLAHFSEYKGHEIPPTAREFGVLFSQMHSSTGENVLISLETLFNKMFSKDANLKFDYKEQFQELYPDYVKYVDEHRSEDIPDAYTVLLDEPDRNLDIENARSILGILSEKKEQTQLIATVHNPLIIYSLAKNSSIHFIEMTPGYVGKVLTEVDKIIGK